jgi:hypothetical protein
LTPLVSYNPLGLWSCVTFKTYLRNGFYINLDE